MRKSLVLLLFITSAAYGQNTVTLPASTVARNWSVRTLGTDTLRQHWINDGLGYNRYYSGTEANQRFELLSRKTATQSSSTTNYPNWLGVTNYVTGLGYYTLPALTSGSVIFSNGTTLSQDNTNFFWDNTNKWLGVGNAPLVPLHIKKSGAAITPNSNTIGLFQNNSTTATGSNISIVAGANALSQILLGDLANVSSGRISYDNLTDNLIFYANTNEGPRILSNGILQTPNLDNYLTDLSGSYTPRSKVDKAYVDATVLTNTLSAAATLTLTTSGWYTFNGTSTTWTLPTIAGTTNRTYYIKNRGSGTITINSSAGGNDIYFTSAVNTITVSAGDAIILHNDSGVFNVQ